MLRVLNTILLNLLFFAVASWWYFYLRWWGVAAAIAAIFAGWSVTVFALAKLTTQGDKKLLRRWMRQILQSPVTTTAILGLALASALPVIFFIGVVHVTSSPSDEARQVTITSHHGSADAASAEAKTLTETTDVYQIVWGTSWWCPAQKRVKVAGYPVKVVAVKPLVPTKLTIPHSFTRPVVLIRPTTDLIDMLKGNPKDLFIRIGPRIWSIPQLEGRAVWIGCDSDVKVPARLQEAWRADVETAARLSYADDFWLQPNGLHDVPIEVGTAVRVWLETEDGRVYSERRFTVRPVGAPSDFPQVEDLHVPQ